MRRSGRKEEVRRGHSVTHKGKHFSVAVRRSVSVQEQAKKQENFVTNIQHCDSSAAKVPDV